LRISRASAATASLVALALAASWPALGQQKPESILPPGFDEPVAPAPTAAATQAAGAPATPGAPQSLLPTGLASGVPGAAPSPTPTPTASPTVDAATLARYELPLFARRSLASVGPVPAADGGMRPNALGNANGRWLEALMRELDTPVASRWLSIGLRRMLVSRLDTPMRVNGADFAAERAFLLLRMGEADSARAVVQSVDNENYTPKLLQMAMQSALANGDPGELCGLTSVAAKWGMGADWTLAQAMCLGLGGQPGPAQAAIRAAKRQNLATGIDMLLAEKVSGLGANGRQSVTIEWNSTDQLSAWRYGLGTASGETIPDDLFDTVKPWVRIWQALSPRLDVRHRVDLADQAAVRGALSSEAMIDLYGALDPNDDQATAELGVARDLRQAYEAPTAAGRLTMLKNLWDEPKTADGRYARLVLTARAAAALPVNTSGVDADRLVAAMLTAGLDRTAQKWAGHVPSDGDAWAMLLLSDPDSMTRHSYSEISGYAPTGDNAARKRQLFFAGMAGLGRMSADQIERGARGFDVKIGNANAWTRAIDRAAIDRQPATAMLLAGIGMQTPLWLGVSPEALYHIVAALHATGQDGMARMIAAEAIARL
jgi:hypothetical protein